jgi:amidase
MDAADLMFAGVARQRELLAGGEIPARRLVQASLDRIAALDGRLNAFRVVLGASALAAADAIEPGDPRPLAGVPVAIKDDTPVAGEPTVWGSNAFDGPAPADAEVVRRLREAGAIVVGITHVPEMAIVPFCESPTWGATRNPWDEQRTPGGSSGGAAVAVAAGMVAAAVGSDGGGSIRIPAGCCGIFGLKPQRDRVSTAPAREPFQGLTVLGPLARRAIDAALVLDALTDGTHDFAAAAATEPARPLTIAVSTKVPAPVLGRPDAEQRQAVQDTAALLRSLGHIVVEREVHYGALMLNFNARYLRGIADACGAMARPDRLSRRTRAFRRLGRLYPEKALAAARAAEPADRERLGRLFADGVDALLTPMFTRRPVPVGTWEGRGALATYEGMGRFVPYCPPWNVTGQPAMSVPAGFAADGFPLAVQIVAPPDGEPALLSLAAQLERARGWPAVRPPIA